jgi:23S rRNA (cytidine1920-2'-O)/16S rRNA (cytidine1409-2'-O)-methyltransferase
MKQRLDLMIVERNLIDSREKGRRLILAGLVFVNGHPATKPGISYKDDIEITLKKVPRFVSRGGDKILGAFKAFNLDVKGAVCMDVGSSTGGFTDCMLQHGATKVYAVDVGTAQLHYKMRKDDRVVVMEKTNARYFDETSLPELVDFISIDVSFISLKKILPAVVKLMKADAQMVSLIKPQFEVGRDRIEKGGVVRNHDFRLEVVADIVAFGEAECGLESLGMETSPLKGPKGNVEFLAWWKLKES